jgi:hypothetical protein
VNAEKSKELTRTTAAPATGFAILFGETQTIRESLYRSELSDRQQMPLKIVPQEQPDVPYLNQSVPKVSAMKP